MAKVAGLKGVKAETPVGEAMGIVFPRKVKSILKHEATVRENDVDGVHDMRVETKRLREAARLFRPAFGRKRLGRHLEHLADLNDFLGRVRELDVLGIQLRELGERQDGLAEALEPLVDSVAQRRDEADEALLPVLNDTLGFLKRDFRELLEERSKKRKSVWQMSMRELGCQEIGKRVVRAFELEQSARDPESVREFHRMRIAVKKLKYALELFLNFVHKRARKAYKPIAQLQELMGDVHDRDVLLATLEAAKSHTLDEQAAAQAKSLVADDRRRLHAETVELLDAIHEAQIPERLLSALKCKV